jgi:hypothetical protein
MGVDILLLDQRKKPMRIAPISVSLAAAMALAACASTGGTNTYEAEYRQLNADCQARGGILAATGAQSGRPQNDNVCEIRNGSGRLPASGS